jgi:hypothetical protein
MAHQLDEARRLADESMAFEWELGDPTRLALACLVRVTAAAYRGDVADARMWLDEARGHAARSGGVVADAHVNLHAGNVALLDGDVEESVRHMQDAVAGFRQHDDVLGLILASSRLTEAATRAGTSAVAADALEDMIELGRDVRASGVVTWAMARLALHRLEQGDAAGARLLAEEAFASCQEGFWPSVEAFAWKAVGTVNLATGHIAEGRSQLRTAIAVFARGVGTMGLGQGVSCWVALSRSLAETGERAEAIEAAEAAMALAERTGDRWVRETARAQLAATRVDADARSG